MGRARDSFKRNALWWAIKKLHNTLTIGVGFGRGHHKLSPFQRTLCLQTVSQARFLMLVAGAPGAAGTASAVRMGDGGNLYRHCQTHEGTILILPFHHSTMNGNCADSDCMEFRAANCSPDSELAVNECTYFAPQIRESS
jgi:hypothetical protein